MKVHYVDSSSFLWAVRRRGWSAGDERLLAKIRRMGRSLAKKRAAERTEDLCGRKS